MMRVVYDKARAESFIEFRKWLIESGDHCGYLSYDGDSYRGVITFCQNVNKNNSKDKFLIGIEKLAQLVKDYS